MTTELLGTLEIDHERGVIYFHAHDPIGFIGVTVLRICSLPPIPGPLKGMIDLTHMRGVTYER